MGPGTDDPKLSLPDLARRLGRLPADKKRVALEASASIAGVSLRVSREFVEAVPRAARVLSADDLRQWGEFGRRLAMGDAEAGIRFFAEGAQDIGSVPSEARTFVFQVCTRQLVISSSAAMASIRLIPEIARSVSDRRLLTEALRLSSEIAKRSAKHSVDFLEHTAKVLDTISAFDDDSDTVGDELMALASDFADRTGGLAAELWQAFPQALEGLTASNTVRLAQATREFMGFGGSVTLNFVTAGGGVLRFAADAFDPWCSLAHKIAQHGNAVLISFLRSSPKFFSQVAGGGRRFPASAAARIIDLAGKIAETDAESALAMFRSSTSAILRVSVDQLDEWVEAGLKEFASDAGKARRSYFALETRESNARLLSVRHGLSLERVQHVLRLYVEALTGNEVVIEPLSQLPQETRIGDGKVIYLPASISEFDDDEADFRLYKVLAAYGAGQIEFGTFEKGTTGLASVFTELFEQFSSTAEERDAFSLSGYIEDRTESLPGSLNAAHNGNDRSSMPPDADYRNVLELFPEPRLARRIFGTVENARIDRRLRREYRGLRKDLDVMQAYLRRGRPYIFDVPMHQVPFELLFQISLCGGATDDATQFYSQVISEITSVFESYIDREEAQVADSLMATNRIFYLFQNITAEQVQEASDEEGEPQSEFAYEDKNADEGVTEDRVKREMQNEKQDISELFDAWNRADEESEPDDLQGSERWSHGEVPEQPLEPDELAYAYDEWDRELNDYRVGWSRVVEKHVKRGDRTFVEITRSKYRGVISSIRRQFQLMKPENLTRIDREYDGEDYDLNALVDFVIDRKADGKQDENIYTKRLRRQRDVAVSFLLDQSSSTARTITRNPLQPYTHPGRRIIEIEKEGLVLMSEALEAVGDTYSISGFTSEGRRNVKFYVVKDFDERYSELTEERIGGITFQNNTRLGAAIRHAATRLLKLESRTKLLIILTDGRPYDHDYGDARYAREDVREALIEAKSGGITPFCITIDRESEAELRDLYGDVGYTIIDDVLSLPERMPNIYRRLTS